jgi:hypothetical protein|tara:strand:+ start:151 stop:357 length:207 start_codon:yes stop_codon:yes gene_type:complete
MVLVLPAILWSKYGSVDPCEILRQELEQVALSPGDYRDEAGIYWNSIESTFTGQGCTSGVLKLAWARI